MVMIRPAQPHEAPALTDIALAAKAHWGYEQTFMVACRDELTITAADIAQHTIRVTVVLDEQQKDSILGFYMIRAPGTAAKDANTILTDAKGSGSEEAGGDIGHMWIRPDRIGAGLGRTLWQDAMKTAAAAGLTHLDIEADPNAEGFYRRMGAVKIGETPSRAVSGRMLPLMRATLVGSVTAVES